MIHTNKVTPGMRVHEVFAECGRAHVQALPFVDGNGAVCGRVTLKHVMRVACLPEHMVASASLLGSFMSCVNGAQSKIEQVLAGEIDRYVRDAHEAISSGEPAIKALALMEQNDTSYLFVIDDGEYRGIVTIQGIAETMSRMIVDRPPHEEEGVSSC
jgi:CBS domain-containing protein